jgi:hypothetical protein
MIFSPVAIGCHFTIFYWHDIIRRWRVSVFPERIPTCPEVLAGDPNH